MSENDKTSLQASLRRVFALLSRMAEQLLLYYRKCELSLYIDEDTGMMETGTSVEKEMSKKLSEMSLEELWKLFPVCLTEYQPC